MNYKKNACKNFRNFRKFIKFFFWIYTIQLAYAYDEVNGIVLKINSIMKLKAGIFPLLCLKNLMLLTKRHNISQPKYFITMDNLNINRQNKRNAWFCKICTNSADYIYQHFLWSKLLACTILIWALIELAWFRFGDETNNYRLK